MKQPEADTRRKRRWPAIVALMAALVVVIGGYAGWRHQHPPYFVGATFEDVTVEPFEIACLSNTMVLQRT